MLLPVIDVGGSLPGHLPRLGFVLGGAFGLDLRGAENAVRVQPAVGQRLRAVAESVGQGIGSRVGDL